MSDMRTLAVLCVCILTIQYIPYTVQSPLGGDDGSHRKHWSYEGDDGPANWKESYKMCAGKQQSPIDIATKSVVEKPDLAPISFTGYDKVYTSLKISNNGHTVTVSISDDKAPTIKLPGMSQEFTFKQFHFHFGSDSSNGSEHSVDGNLYPIEMHLVHMSEELKSKGETGLAVLGILFKESEKDNEAYAGITKELKNVMYKGSKSTISGSIKLFSLLPSTSSFFRYTGSLTTPPCSEGVIWTLFTETVDMGNEQLDAFRQLMAGDENEVYPMANNFRPVQGLNGREVAKATAKN